MSKHSVVKFAHDTTLGDQPIAQGQAAVQMDLERLEEWADRSSTKFSKDKCKALHLGRSNPLQQRRLGCSSAERHPGRQQWALVRISVSPLGNVLCRRRCTTVALTTYLSVRSISGERH